MKPAPFSYHRPKDLGSALDLLEHYGDECKVLAGGVSLIPLMNMRLARPAHLVDIGRLKELDGISVTGGCLHLGALVQHWRLLEHPLVTAHVPLLAEAGRHIGHAAIRSRGTVGGSIAHADPVAEWPCCLLALDARVHLRSARGARSLPLSDFFLTYYTTLMEPQELLTGLVVPIPAPGTGWAFREFARRPGDFALVSACVILQVRQGLVAGARIVLGGVGPVPTRAAGAEELLAGRPVDDAALLEAARAAAAEIDPESDLHASAEYRRHLTGELVYEALCAARTRSELPEGVQSW